MVILEIYMGTLKENPLNKNKIISSETLHIDL